MEYFLLKNDFRSSRVLVFVNGIVDDYQSLAAFIKPSDTIICVDGGLRHAEKLSLPVALMLGDMDSVSDERLKRLSNKTPVLTYTSEKDQTDMELALQWVLKEGYKKVVIVGINGGRLDHTLTNIHLLSRRSWSFNISFWEAQQYTWILKDKDSLNLTQKQGRTLSILPLSESVTGVSIFGMKYPLDNASVSFGSTLGMSNQITCADAKVELQAGVLAVMLHQ